MTLNRMIGLLMRLTGAAPRVVYLVSGGPFGDYVCTCRTFEQAQRVVSDLLAWDRRTLRRDPTRQRVYVIDAVYEFRRRHTVRKVLGGDGGVR